MLEKESSAGLNLDAAVVAAVVVVVAVGAVADNSKRGVVKRCFCMGCGQGREKRSPGVQTSGHSLFGWCVQLW